MRKIIFHPWRAVLTTVFLIITLSAFEVPYSVAAEQENQEVMTPDLKKELARLKEGEFLRVIIRLRDQLTAEARRAVMAKAQERADRRRALITALRNLAKRTQEPILARLKRLQEGRLVRKIRPLWISNVIGLEARREAIEEIVKFDGIEYVKQDVERPVFQQTPAWSVAQINADDVWTTPGLDGDGVIVAVIDTGIDLDHPDLVNRLWINSAEDINSDGQFTAADNNGVDDDGNGYIDDVVGWDLENNDNNVEDWYFLGHGTHVSGTIAGDGTGGTATGVAPGAQIMVLSYSADITAGEAEAWDGMQYALDNGAHIVNFSSGWKDSWSPDYQTWRDNVDVLADAGILFVSTTGNDSPHVAAPGDVLTPGRAPRALTLGSTDNTDTIATDSGQGPTSWEGVTGYDDYIHPPGLLKPDVTAPGESVNSTQIGGGYVTMSGTSMAAPHASGTAALLLEQDSALLPHELIYIIRETSVDLGATGPDVVYGYGRIDALAAVNHTYSTTPVYDLSVTGTNAVWTSIDIWVDNNDDGIPDDPVALTDNHLYARIRNIGGQAVGNVEIKFYYADVGTLGISGFDPNNDGDPDDGNFNYIDSYFVPVIGPAGSSQDTAIGVIDWNVPVPLTDHWCVGIGIVAPNPPNATEADRTNNVAFKNFFNIIVTYSQVLAFKFFVYPHPQMAMEQFDLEFIRRGLPEEFEVEFAVEKRLAEKWFRKREGFVPVKRIGFKNLPVEEEWAEKRGERIEAYVRLDAERGLLRGIAAPEGKPVLVNLFVRAPSRRVAEQMKQIGGDQLLVINARNQKGVFGGMALRIHLKDLKIPQEEPKEERPLYFIKVDDAVEAALIEQQLQLKPVMIRDGLFYYYGDERLNARLREFGYEPGVAEAGEVFERYVCVSRTDDENPLLEAGARILLREQEYWLVMATTNQLRTISRLGYKIRAVSERELRPRIVRIYVQKKEEVGEIAKLLSDIFSIEPEEQMIAVYGAAWDDMIDKMRARGYSVEIKPDGGK